MEVAVAILELAAELLGIAKDAMNGKITAEEARAKAQAASAQMIERTGGAGTWDKDLAERERE